MEKSNCMLMYCGRIVVLLFVLFIAVCCTQDYEDVHTIYVNDTIQKGETESHSADNIGLNIQTETNPITKSISFCEETQCYDGVFLSLYSDYAKSELTTDIIPLDETVDIVIGGTFITDTSGDMVRLIMRYYDGDILLSEKIFTGMTLNDRTTDMVQNAAIPLECNGIVIAIQAKYDSKKGGSKTDVIRVCNIKASHITNNDEIICKEIYDLIDEDELADVEENTDDITEELEYTDLSELIIGDESDDNVKDIEEYIDETSDVSNEKTQTEIEYYSEEIPKEVPNDMSDDNTIIYLIDEDESADIEENTDDITENLEFTESFEFIVKDESNDHHEECYTNESNNIYEATVSNLRTDYNKCHIEMTDFIKMNENEITVALSIYSKSSGDMVRTIIEYYDEGFVSLGSKTLTGTRSSAGEWVTNIKNVLLIEETFYIKVCLEAKYETKKGGSTSDTIVCRINLVRE